MTVTTRGLGVDGVVKPFVAHQTVTVQALLGTRATLDALRLIPGLEVSEITSGCSWISLSM